jgi:hypothetical protein
MTFRDQEKSLVAALRSRFPADATLTDEWLRERGWDPTDDSIAFSWVEAFADRTTEAVKRRDAEAIREQTAFVATAYRAAPDALRAIVDVSYAENLMWDVSDDDKRWAWPHIADDIQQLFAQMWGDPTEVEG